MNTTEEKKSNAGKITGSDQGKNDLKKKNNPVDSEYDDDLDEETSDEETTDEEEEIRFREDLETEFPLSGGEAD